jgi:CRP-like cAMP-binding protein
MTQNDIDISAILKSCSVFAKLDESQLRELAGKARIEHFAERTLLALRGERAEHLRYVVSGTVDLVLSAAEGGYSCLPMFEGRWATWLGCFGSEPLIHDLWSSGHATAVAFPCRDVLKAVSDNPEALRQVIDQVGEWTRFLTGWMLSFSAYAPEKRLAYLLMLASSNACGLAREGQATALTQTHISQFGFGSRQKVGRLLRSLSNKGLIATRYGSVLIPSRARLEAYISDDATATKAAPSRARRA